MLRESPFAYLSILIGRYEMEDILLEMVEYLRPEGSVIRGMEKLVQLINQIKIILLVYQH